MRKDDLIVTTGNHTLYATNGAISNITLIDGTLSLKSHTMVLFCACVVGNVSMESHTFIYELHMLAPGELFFRGINHRICRLFAPHHLVVHLPKGHDWKEFIGEFYGGRHPIEVRYDI